MAEQTDAEFIAEVKANFENGEVDDCPHLCVACEYIPAAHLARTAIPRLIKMVEDRERQRDEAKERCGHWVLRLEKAEAERDAALAEAAKLRAALIPIVDEFSCTIEQYNKIGPDFTHKDGTEVFTVQTVLDREPLIVAARDAFAPKETP